MCGKVKMACLFRRHLLHFTEFSKTACLEIGQACPYISTTQIARCFSSQSQQKTLPGRMATWQLHQYQEEGLDEVLTFEKNKELPVIQKPNELMIEVKAASVNPIDVEMRGGYGSSLFNKMRYFNGTLTGGSSEFPLTLGRDCSGVVVDTGTKVTKFKPGDEVWMAVAAHRQGTFSQYLVAGDDEVAFKPKSVSHLEAASIPYVAATTWSALCNVAGLQGKKAQGKRVLIIGGSGGIGTFAIQLIKAWGSSVTTTCSTDAISMVKELGADHVIDYKTQDVWKELKQMPGIHVVLDPIGNYGTNEISEQFSSKESTIYVSLTAPLLPNTDKYGLLPGLGRSAFSLLCKVKDTLPQGLHYRWAFFAPNGQALQVVANLVDEGQIKPVIDKVFQFEELPKAFEKVGKKSGRGKTVIDIAGYGQQS